MSLDAWEERALSSIAEDLAASAPELASRLSAFNRVTCDEQMPGDRRAKEEGRRGCHRSRPRRRVRRGRAGRRVLERRILARTAGEGAWPLMIFAGAITTVTAVAIILALTVHPASGPPGGTRQAAHCGWTMTCSGR